MLSPGKLTSLLAAAAPLLVACGGGSDSGTSPTGVVMPPLEGLYQGTTSRNDATQTLVLETGEIWNLAGSANSLTGAFIPTSFIQGTGGSSSNLIQNVNLYTVPDIKQITRTQSVTGGTLTASYLPRTSIRGTVTLNDGSNFTIASGPFASGFYNYDLPPSPDTVNGLWAGKSLDGNDTSLTIDSTAKTFVSVNADCTLTGTIAPRASGKNVFDIVAQYGAAPCTRPGLGVRGIAINYPLPTGQQQLTLAVIDAVRASGTVFTAAR
ncbi:MAG: hypothetical protein V4505_00550 [Pseudomonadota bacterium]